MAAEWTYDPGLVFNDNTLQPQASATGTFRDRAGGVAQPVFDMQGNQMTGLTTGPLGYLSRFRANIPSGVVDFGSVIQPVVSAEAMNSGPAAAAAASAAAAAEQNAGQSALASSNAAASALSAQNLVQGYATRMQTLEAQVADLLNRIAVLEGGAPSGGGGTTPPTSGTAVYGSGLYGTNTYA